MRKVAALLLLLLAVAGCGSSEATETEPETQALTAGQVAREFAQETGRSLEEAPVGDAAWQQLGYGLNPSPQIQRTYGIFNVYVVEGGNEEAVGSLLSDKGTGEALEADADGIYWEQDSLSGTWVAYKRYGDNVVLTWFSEKKRQETDARWERLDAILSGLASR